LKTKENRIDGAIALIVIATIVLLNLVMAVAVGAAIAIIIFIHTQIKAPRSWMLGAAGSSWPNFGEISSLQRRIGC